jgi:hypothetical protein
MQAATSLLDFILNLLKDPQAQAEFRASPEQVLATNCLTGVCAADIHETLPLVTDHRSVELAGPGHSAPPVALVGDTGIHGAIHYLHYITGTYRYDDHGSHGHEPGHENIWAVGDVGHDFDGPHPDPSAPGSDGSDRAGDHWMHDGHGMDGGHGGAPGAAEQIYGDHSGQIYGDHSGQIYGDHTGQIYGDHTGRIYGDHTNGDDHGPAGSSAGDPATGTPGGNGSGPGDGHLHSFGSGAGTTVTSNTSGSPSHSGDTGSWHQGSGPGTPADTGHTDTTSPDDAGHSTDASSLGDSSYDHHAWDPDHYDDHGWDLHL